MPLSWGLTARYKRRSSRVLEAYAWAGRAKHTVRFSSSVRCVQMLIMLMGRRLSLSVMRGLNRETPRSLALSVRSPLIPHRAHLLFPAGLLPKAREAPTRQRDRFACSKHRVDGINPGVNPRAAFECIKRGMTPVIKKKMTVPYVRASTRPFTAITLYLSKRKEFNTGLYNVSALSLRFAYVGFVGVMAVYYLAKYRYFLIRPGACGPRRSSSSGDSAMGPLIVMRTSRAWGPEAATQPLGPRKSATECALSSERLGPVESGVG